jgi:hypothetical protein
MRRHVRRNSSIGSTPQLNGWSKQLSIAAGGLALGVGLMPVLIHFAGILLLGSYEGASLQNTFRSILGGLAHGSTASWIVVLGPYCLFQMFRALGLWWRTVS